MLINAIHLQSVKLKECSHPFRVTFGQVIVDRDDVNSFAGQCIQVNGQCGHEGFPLPGSHLGNLSLVENDPTDQLAIIMDHVPSDHIPSSHPGALEPCFVAGDLDTGSSGSQLTIHL